MIVDVHAHALREQFFADIGIAPNERGEYVFPGWGYGPIDRLVYDLEARLRSLAARGVDLQLVGPPPRLISDVDRAADVELCRLLNKHAARLVDEAGGRLGGLAVPALAQPDRAADELRRAVGDCGFKGAMIGTTAAGKPLDGPEFEPLFAAFEELGLLVFMHATPGVRREALEEYTLRTLVGFPHETTVTVARLIFAGVLERHPGLHLVLSHGGGALPYLKGRLDRGYFAPKHEFNPACRANISKPPGDYFRQLYFDTCVLSPASLRFMVEVVGADHVMFGTDFPFEIGDAGGELALPAIRELPAADQEKILGGNAAKVLGLSLRRPT